jgi:hypothetical protein
MSLDQSRQIDIGHGVAVDDQEFVIRHQRERTARSARRAQNRILPGVADIHIDIRAVTHHARDRLGEVMQVDDDIASAT